MAKRITALLLCILMVLSLLPVRSAAEETAEVRAQAPLTEDVEGCVITVDGTPVENIALPQNQRTTLTAVSKMGAAEGRCRWMILVDETSDFWVDIFGAEEASLTVTYAMVKTMLNSNDQVWIRCACQGEAGEVLSDAVCITMLPPEEPVPEQTVIAEETQAAAEEETQAAAEEETQATTEEETQAAAEEETQAATEEETQAATEEETQAAAEEESQAAAEEETEAAEEAATEPVSMEAAVAEPVSEDAVMLAAEEAASEDEIIKKYVLSIRYVYADTSIHAGEVVAPTWSAELSSVQAYSATIDSPTIPGYAPDPATVEFHYEEGQLDANVQVIVRYHPSTVGYTVKHYWQNVHDDYYVEHEIEAKTGITESRLPDNLGNGADGQPKYPGFEALPYIADTIAADGSTVVEVYHDRVYYLMSFNLNGGYGVHPIFARYGTDLVVNNPTRVGYEFAGWTDAAGNTVTVPDTMPAEKTTYYAKWTPLNANYKVVYWAVNDDGTRSLIGSHIERGTAESLVSGEDDLATSYICGYETTHVHVDSCYNCGQTAHEHTKDACFVGMDLGSNDPGNGVNAIKALEDGGAPESGYIYVIYNPANGTYWPKLYVKDSNGNGAYYVVNSVQGGSTAASFSSIVEGDAIKTHSGTFGTENLTVTKYRPKTSCATVQHIHQETNRTCSVHTHVPQCSFDTKYLEYVPYDTEQAVAYKTDKNVTIDGDGTSVVNVYYQYKQYTLKFYYAATTGGRDTDDDGVIDTYDSVKIVGGSTYYFGTLAPDTSDDETLLESMYWNHSGLWGNVTALPTLNDRGMSRHYTIDSETYDYTNYNGTTTAVTYHYISFTARYGSNIAGLWPCAVFNSATRTNVSNNTNGWSGTEAFVSAWNGEHHVKYTQTQGNQTIKGIYEILDEELIFASNFTDEREVSYLCFWENGCGGVDWNVPRLFRYNIYLETYSGQDLTGLTVKTRNGTTYYLADTYDTCDDSDANGQTQVSLKGYTKDGRTSSAITDFDRSLYASATEVNFFYNAETYKLIFWNHDDYLQKGGTGSPVKYGTMLKNRFDYYAEVNGEIYRGANQLIALPECYPKSLEPGVYVFEGWYLSDQFKENEKVNPDTMFMPAENIMVYAHWVPILHSVSVYRYRNADGTFPNGTDILLVDHKVPHGSLIQTEHVPQKPDDSGHYKFDGWFYIGENNEELAFDFENIPVDRDLQIYAKWTTDMVRDVTVRYVTIVDGKEVEIAPSDSFSAYVDSLKTYEAKTGDALYEGYREGYFPNAASSSITVSETGDNELIFVYKPAEKVPYEVRYLIEDEDGTRRPAFRKKGDGYEFDEKGPIAEADVYVKQVPDNTKAVVTEDYIRIPSYVPDAMEKRLILSTEASQNVITFVYKYNPTQAYYKVNHYVLKPGRTASGNLDDYDLYTDSEILGNVGETYTAKPITIPGTTFDEETTQNKKGSNTWDTQKQTLSAKLEQGNTTSLNFFYDRQYYPYRVRYVEQDTNLNMLPAKTEDESGKTLTAQYGSAITETAPEIPGFKVDAQTKVHTVQIGQVAANTITFYYTRLTGDLEISKHVALDEQQQAQDPGLRLPEGADTQPFAFVVSSETAFYKQSFDYTITRKDGTTESGTITVASDSLGKILNPIEICHEERVVIHDLALGSYLVTEQAVVGYKTTMNTADREFLNVVLQEDGGMEVVNVVNTYPFYTGDLVLKKQLKPVEGAPSGENELFTYTIEMKPKDGTLEEQRIIRYKTYDDNGNRVDAAYTIEAKNYDGPHVITLKLKAAEKVTVSGVPVGAFNVVETVDEHYATDYYKVIYDKETAWGTGATVDGNIIAGHTTEVGYTNTYKTDGKLTIQKTVTSEVDYDNWEKDTFTFEVTGTTQLPDGDYAVIIDGKPGKATVTNGVITLDVKPTITVTKGEGISWSENLVIEKLPAGTYCVEEVSSVDGLDKYNVTPDTKKVENLALLGASMEATAEITNQYKRTTGSLTISKVINPVQGGAQINPEQEFTFTVQMPTDTPSEDHFEGMTIVGTMQDEEKTQRTFKVEDGKITVTLKHEESITLEGMPIGVYTIVETPIIGYESEYLVTDDNDKKLSEVRVKTDEETTVACTNNYPVYIGKLTITRINSADADQVFVYNITNTQTNAVVTVTVVGESSTVVNNLPYGTYTITEESTWSWRYNEATQEVKIGIDEKPDSAEVTFSQAYDKIYWLNGNSPLIKNRWWKGEN